MTDLVRTMFEPADANTKPIQPEMERLLKHACEQMGMKLHRLEGSQFETKVTVRTIPCFASVTFDNDIMLSRTRAAELLLDHLDAARRTLFNEVAKHIAEHDRSPRDRLEQVESAASALVEHLKQQGIAGKTADLVFKLMALLDAKSGAVAWRDPR